MDDFAIMKIFLCIKRFINPLSSVNYPITKYAANYCKKIDFTAQEVVNDYINLLYEFKRRFAHSDDLGSGLQGACLRKNLENDVDKYETLLTKLLKCSSVTNRKVQIASYNAKRASLSACPYSSLRKFLCHNSNHRPAVH